MTHLPGVPGEVQNIKVKIGQDGSITVSGDDQISLLAGFALTRHVTLRLRPYVNACQLQMHVLHADLDGVPASAFYTQIENQINQQLQISSNELPQGFTYCMTGVRATPDGLFVSLSATPSS
jgi:hypothetical protein